MTIKEWASDDRPREKMLARGESSLSDAELVAILLREGGQGRDAVATARELLHQVGGLIGLSRQSAPQLMTLKGVGPAKAAMLLATTALARRLFASDAARSTVQNYDSLRRLAHAHLHGRPVESFLLIMLDQQLRLLQCVETAVGTVNHVTVYPRELIRRVIDAQAANVVVAHNHPSGCAEPSHTDIQLTEKLKEALRLIDVRLIDHFIVGDGEPVSLARLGYL